MDETPTHYTPKTSLHVLPSGPRRLVIQNRRQLSTADIQARIDSYFDTTWATLRSAIDDILASRPLTNFPLDRLSRGVEGICRDGQAERLRVVFTKYLGHVLEERVRGEVEKAGEGVNGLRVIVECWNRWRERTKHVRQIFAYLDRSYLRREKKTPLSTMTVSLFRSIVFCGHTAEGPDEEGPKSLGPAVTAATLQLIDDDRHGRAEFDSTLLRDAVSMLHMLGLYNRLVQKKFLDQSVIFLDTVAKKIQNLPLKQYAIQCENLWKSEESRCHKYTLNGPSHEQLAKAFHTFLIRAALNKFLDVEALAVLLQDRDIVTLRKMYHLVTGAQTDLNPEFVAALVVPWKSYILQSSSSIIRTTEDHETVVPLLMSLQRSLNKIAADAFGSHESLTSSLRDSLKTVLNSADNHSRWPEGAARMGEFVARYMDKLLRNGAKAVPDILKDGTCTLRDDADVLKFHLDEALALFRLVDGKDAFQAFYKKDLSRRLLQDRSVSYDAERWMLERLREECGSNFTHHLDLMFQDKENYSKEMAAFQAWSGAKGITFPTSLGVLVVSSGSWPSIPADPIKLPPVIKACLEPFEAYYRERQNGRHLKWATTNSHCSLRTTWTPTPYELTVAFPQAVVLLLFNESSRTTTLTTEEISKKATIEMKDLYPVLQSLISPRHPLLLHKLSSGAPAPATANVGANDLLELNMGFSSATPKVKVGQVRIKQVTGDTTATSAGAAAIHAVVTKDRMLEIQSAIMRIMKARKECTHTLLVAEVVSALAGRGVVDGPTVKKEIGKLLDKEYLERKDGEESYLYID